MILQIKKFYQVVGHLINMMSMVHTMYKMYRGIYVMVMH